MDELALRDVEPPTPQPNGASPIADREPTPPPVVECVAPPVTSAALPEPVPPPVAATPTLPPTPPVPAAKARDSRRTARRWIVERCRETPAWLASLVLHLALLVTFGTIMIPYGRGPVVDILLVLLSGRDDTEVASQPVIFAPDIERVEPGEKGQAGDALAPHQEQMADVTEMRVDAPLVEAPANKPLDVVDGQDLLVSTTPAPQGREREALPRPADPGVFARELQIIAESAMQTMVEQKAHNDVVDRFIQFDIGKLRGAEGERARHDFNQLGPDSLPALIRGLNKSAYISATCPVMVLQSKIQHELSQTKDPATLQYALDNIGKGVSPKAAHAKILATLRAALRKKALGDERFIRETLAERELPDLENKLPRIRELRSQPYAAMATVLESEDENERLAAMVAISIRDDAFSMPDGQRVDLARRLIAVLDEPDERLRRESHQALLSLAFEDVPEKPDDKLAIADPRAAAQRWTKSWEQFSKARKVEARANSALKIADFDRDRQQEQKAIDRYFQIIADFPGTSAAEHAQQRLADSPPPPRKRSTKGLDLTKQ